jgi:hypothetical protein
MFNTKKEMKAKLITDGKNNYSLLDYNNELIGTTMESMITDQKLSKQNCDEIFGVVNVEKLAEDHPLEVSNASHGFGIKDGIIYGFNKAMELNKDKVFTLEDMKFAWSQGEIGELSFSDIIQSLQQLTEIEVEIEMFTPAATYGHSGWHEEPKLDKNGCLILKKL